MPTHGKPGKGKKKLFPSYRITNYLVQVMKESLVSEKRTGWSMIQFGVIEDYVLICVSCRYERVVRKFKARLERNFQKHYGYIPLVFTATRFSTSDMVNGVNVEGKNIQVNYTIAYLTMLGREYTLNVYNKESSLAKYLNPDFGEEITEKSLDYKLKKECGSPVFYGGKAEWARYCEAYRKIYGKEPPARHRVYLYDSVRATSTQEDIDAKFSTTLDSTPAEDAKAATS